jgi:triosephosphate isomerase
MRQPIITANWKLYKPSPKPGSSLLPWRSSVLLLALDVVIAAPFTALAALQDEIRTTPFRLAAQNLFWENSGAYTGEVSAPMLVDVGCAYVIIGHSERRQYFGETDATVAKKVAAALQAGLRPIVCIGESLAQRQAGETFAVLERQVQHGLAACQSEAMSQVALAYEPCGRLVPV